MVRTKKDPFGQNNNDGDNTKLLAQQQAQAHEDLQTILLHTIRRGIFSSTVLSWILSYVTCGYFFKFDSSICYYILGSITIGLIAGETIGTCTEYATSFAYKPTISIAKKSRIGSAGVIIQGLCIGMLSTVVPTFIICVAVLGCYELAGDYGIAIGMLSTLGVTLATDAFGPVADNAGGIAEMAELDKYVRDTTDGLDALGNTTAATGKWFAIGSAVLTALALLAEFKNDAGLTTIDISSAEVLVVNYVTVFND